MIQTFYIGRIVAPKSDTTTLTAAALLTLLCLLLVMRSVSAETDNAQPDTRHTPQQVVQILVRSLQFNDAKNDAGIATVFRFASPANKVSTGPLPRFRQMIHRGYPEMLNHSSARFEPIQILDDTALQVVWLRVPDGREVGYAFQLRRQQGGEFDEMWMTDAVLPLGPSEKSGLRI